MTTPSPLPPRAGSGSRGAGSSADEVVVEEVEEEVEEEDEESTETRGSTRDCAISSEEGGGGHRVLRRD